MSNNAPDYENNLAFDPDINTMPRCDIEALKSEIKRLKDLLKECRFILREMSDVNNWLESDDCVLNYDMATECEKYATKIDNAIGENN